MQATARGRCSIHPVIDAVVEAYGAYHLDRSSL
jgi:hypothetical protein